MVNAVENYLREIGASSAVTWEHPTEPYRLRWGRVGGKPRIAVESTENDFLKAWGDCSRYLRLKMFVGVPILLTEIRAEIESLYQESFEAVSKTMKELEKIMTPIED